jgi:multiple sugar transport system substrate-binding protein
MVDRMSRRSFLATATGVAAGALAGAAVPRRRALAQSQTKVTFGWPFSDVSQAFHEQLARRFMDAHKTIEVEVQIIPQTQALPKLTAAFSGGAAPDCLALSHQWLAQFARGGYLESLESRLRASGLNRALAAPLLSEARVGSDTVYSAGMRAGAYVLYCNTAVLQEAGVAEPPRTFDDFDQAARKMTDARHNRYGYYLLGGTGWSYNQWTTWMFAHGGAGASNSYFDGPKCVLRGDSQIAGLQRWLDLYQKDKVSPDASATAGWQDSANAFSAGQVGMIFGWTPLIGTFSKTLGPSGFVVAPPPSGPAGQFFYFGGDGLVLNKRSQVKDAAWEYLQYLLSPEVNGLIAQQSGTIPGNTRAWSQAWLAAPTFRTPLSMLQSATKVIQLPIYLPDWPKWFLDVCPPSIQKTLLGQQTAAQHADGVSTTLETMLAAYKRR